MLSQPSCRVQIAVRMRPLLNDFEDEAAWLADERNHSIVSMPRRPLTLESGSKKKHNQSFCQYSFTYDHVFGSEATTHSLYEKSCQPLITNFLQGGNCTIFMYGQTTSGKTFTMLGDGKQQGIINFSLRDIYTKFNRSSRHLSISYLQIYNEQINDLLTPGAINLRLQQDYKQGVQVQGLKYYQVDTLKQAQQLLVRGEEQRSYKQKNIHDHSSRSHTIFQIRVVEQNGRCRQCLNLVDLAGSQRLQDQDKSSQMTEQTGYINKSLFVLSNVINKLAKGKKHVPFRDSKLTRLLSSSLNGNSQTMIICTLSPAAMNFSQTLSTLRFATNAKKVETKNNIQREDTEEKGPTRQQFECLREENDRLRRQLSQMEAKERQKENCRKQTTVKFDTLKEMGKQIRQKTLQTQSDCPQSNYLQNLMRQLTNKVPENHQATWSVKASNLCDEYLKNIFTLQNKYRTALLNITDCLQEREPLKNRPSIQPLADISRNSTTASTPPFSSTGTPNRKTTIAQRIMRRDIFNDITVSVALNADHDEQLTLSQLNVAYNEARQNLVDRHAESLQLLSYAGQSELFKPLEKLFTDKLEILQRAYRQVCRKRGY